MNQKQHAAEVLGEEVYRQLFSFIARRVSRQEDAEEIVQNTYLNLLKSENAVAEQKVQSWLFVAARNAVIDHYRKKRDHQFGGSIETLASSSEDERTSIEQISSCLIPLMKNLPKEDARLLEEIDMKGASQKEYAAQNNLSYSALRSKVQRSRQKLKEQLLNCCKMSLGSKGSPIDFHKSDGCC